MPERVVPYESTDTPEVDEYLADARGELAFDIGANRGDVASMLAVSFARVIACEPSRDPFEELCLHTPPNVTRLPVAVSDHPGTITLDYREFSRDRGYLFTGDSLEEWGKVTGSVSVLAVTLVDLATTYGQPDFIKIDTEGHELLVALGGLDVLRGAQFCIEVHDRDHGAQLARLLPEYRVIRHAGRNPETAGYHDHYWMVSK